MTAVTLSAAAVAMLSGCYTVNYVEQATAYGPSYVSYVSRSGSMPTEVFGNPFGTDSQADAELVSMITLPNGHGSKPAHIMTAKERAEGHRLVLVFNPADKLIDGHKVCENSRFETAPANGTFVIQAALCSHSSVISEARANVPLVITNINDETFQNMMYSVLAALLPLREGSRNHQCGIKPCA